MKQIIFNVLDNACCEVSREWVELLAEREGDNLVLSIGDRGPGFAPEMLTQLRKALSLRQGPRRLTGHGACSWWSTSCASWAAP